jgi:hypothetical protein
VGQAVERRSVRICDAQTSAEHLRVEIRWPGVGAEAPV